MPLLRAWSRISCPVSATWPRLSRSSQSPIPFKLSVCHSFPRLTKSTLLHRSFPHLMLNLDAFEPSEFGSIRASLLLPPDHIRVLTRLRCSSTKHRNAPDFASRATRPSAAGLPQLLSVPITFSLVSFIGIIVSSSSNVIFGETVWSPVDLLGMFLDGNPSHATRFGVRLMFLCLASPRLVYPLFCALWCLKHNFILICAMKYVASWLTVFSALLYTCRSGLSRPRSLLHRYVGS